MKKILNINKKIIIFNLILIFLILNLIYFNFFNLKIYAENTYIKNYSTEIETYVNRFYTSIENDVKNRTAGSVGEKFLALKLSEFLAERNYEKFNNSSSYLQEFELSNLTSNNVVGVINNSSENFVIIGAHYDAVYRENLSYGFNDNISGVAGAITLAETLRGKNFNVILAFFGAEEVGCKGSTYFAKNLPKEVRENTLLYVNFDSIGQGDYLYYYHSDFRTVYGQTIDQNFATNEHMKKYANELYGTSAVNGINYSNLPLFTDASSFLKQGVNSLTFFAGNLQTGNGLGYFETANHAKIMHNTDSKFTSDEVFGNEFISNINKIVIATEELLISDEFNAENFASGQINPLVYSDWLLKGVGVIFIILAFGGYLIFHRIKYGKDLPKTQKK